MKVVWIHIVAVLGRDETRDIWSIIALCLREFPKVKLKGTAVLSFKVIHEELILSIPLPQKAISHTP